MIVTFCGSTVHRCDAGRRRRCTIHTVECSRVEYFTLQEVGAGGHASKGYLRGTPDDWTCRLSEHERSVRPLSSWSRHTISGYRRGTHVDHHRHGPTPPMSDESCEPAPTWHSDRRGGPLPMYVCTLHGHQHMEYLIIIPRGGPLDKYPTRTSLYCVSVLYSPFQYLTRCSRCLFSA